MPLKSYVALLQLYVALSSDAKPIACSSSITLSSLLRLFMESLLVIIFMMVISFVREHLGHGVAYSDNSVLKQSILISWCGYLLYLLVPRADTITMSQTWTVFNFDVDMRYAYIALHVYRLSRLPAKQRTTLAQAINTASLACGRLCLNNVVITR